MGKAWNVFRSKPSSPNDLFMYSFELIALGQESLLLKGTHMLDLVDWKLSYHISHFHIFNLGIFYGWLRLFSPSCPGPDDPAQILWPPVSFRCQRCPHRGRGNNSHRGRRGNSSHFFFLPTGAHAYMRHIQCRQERVKHFSSKRLLGHCRRLCSGSWNHVGLNTESRVKIKK